MNSGAEEGRLRLAKPGLQVVRWCCSQMSVCGKVLYPAVCVDHGEFEPTP